MGKIKEMRVALVHDYLISYGGAERVLEALHEIWPQAPVYVAIKNQKSLGENWERFKDWDIRTSWFQKLPWSNRLISPLRFLLPLVWKSFDFSNYDLVITSSSWAMPRGIITEGKTKHICYCHTPPRYLYGYPESRKLTKFWPIKVYSLIVGHFLRQYDYRISQNVDCFIANSQEVAGRIDKFYRRKSRVIHPPIISLPKKKVVPIKDFYLYVSRLVWPKHPEIAVEACAKLGVNLKVVGTGPLKDRVVNLTDGVESVDYLGRVPDEKLWQLYGEAKGVIFPVEQEDFGMVPLEAAAFGTPTIAFYSGGAKETILPGKTGLYFKKLTVESLVKAIKKFEKTDFSSEDCRQWAENFSKDRFKKEIKSFVQSVEMSSRSRT